MKEVYDFFNRNEGGSVKLRLMEDGRYLLETENVNYFSEHNHEGTGDVKELYALDPDGGPMFTTGNYINAWLTPECKEETPTSIEKIEKVDGFGYVFTLSNNITLNEFREDVIINAKRIQEEHPYLRYGQSVFNYLEEKYGVARYVQFSDGVDCFYVDENVEPFIELAWKWYIKIQKERG
jgi:hypothetical protein